MDKQAEQLLSKIILKWGIQAQKWQAIEEVGEFLQALNKLNRVKLKDPLKEQGDPAFEKARIHLCEEIADVQIMMQQMQVIFGIQEVEQIKSTKLYEIRKRLELE